MLHFHKQGLRSSNLILLFLLLFTYPLFPQLLLRGVAPLTPGNYWKYLITNDGIGYIDSVSFLVKDSVVNINNREYFVIQVKDVITYDIYCGLGTDSFYVRYDENGEDSLYKYLKYNCYVGETWSQHHSSNTIVFSVVDSFQVNAWGENYIAKEIYLTSDNGFLQMHFLWADSLGLLSEFSESEYTAGLAGCVINGQLYGDTAMYVTSVNDLEQPPQEFILLQNYPNPFNPSTSISYHLPQGGFVSLKVFDILGRKVAVLLNQWEPSGHYSVEFNAKDLSSGIYFYRISVNDFISTKKMLLIK